MKIAYNPKTGAALTTAPANNDITFDLKGLNIFVRGEKFKGTDTTYSVFKKHTSAGSGGYNGLVPVPSYSTTNIRFLREDGTWSIPSAQASIYTQLTNQDLNDFLNEGRWYYARGDNATTNKPSGVTAYELYVGRNANGYRYQKLITHDGIIWFRYYNASTWTSWVRWYTDANTDQNVLQTESTTEYFKPIVLGYTYSNTPSDLNATITQKVYTTTSVYVQPSTGSLWATKLYSGGKQVITEHQSLSNYVTLDTKQTITGYKTFTRPITNSYCTVTYLSGNQGNALINSTAAAGSYVMLFKGNSTNGYFTHGVWQTKYLLQYTTKSTVTEGTNSVTKSVTLLDESGNSQFPGNVTALKFIGKIDWSNIDGKPSCFTPCAHTHSSDQITTLTSYIKATSDSALSTSDSLNTALGKLEYKGDLGVTAYNLVNAAYDGDGTIENLNEILKVLEGIKDTETIKGLLGKYLPLTGGTMTGTLTTVTAGTNSYNQGIRINRTATNQWATLLIGKSGTATSGTGTSTVGDGAWLIATPASSNSLIFNLNGASETVGLCLKGHGNTDMKWNNNTVWHAGNDGSGSGLDADTLDGNHSSSFAMVGHNHDDKYVRRWLGVYGSANKFLKLVIDDEKGWIRLEVSDSNNGLSGSYGIYMIGWGYHGNNGTDTLGARCLYTNNSQYITALKVVRTSRNNYDLYFQFVGDASYPGYTITYSKSVTSIDCTVTAVTTIPTATWTSSLSALQLNASQVDWSGIQNKPSEFNPSSHTHNYLPLSGGTMTGALNFKNNTWNLMGDDAYIGDCNVAGMIGIKGANAATPGFVLWDNRGTLLGKLYASGDTLNWSGGTIKATTFSGNASSATKLTSSAGNAALPIYFSEGKPVACTMSTGNRAGVLRSFMRGTYTSANQYFGNGTIVAIDPKGTGCISSNDTIFSLGDSSIRNTQLLFSYDRDGIYYRRITESLNYGDWKRLAFITDNVGSADKLTTSAGSSILPVYFSDGKPVACTPDGTLNNMINSLSAGTIIPQDNDYYICQYAGGGTTTTTYHRRPTSALYSYIKNKAEGTWNINVTGNSATATNADTVDNLHANSFVRSYNSQGISGDLKGNYIGMSASSGITSDWWHILCGAWNGEYRWNSQIAFPTQNRNGMYYRSGLDDNTTWGAWVKLLDTGNSSISGNTITLNGSSITVSESDHTHAYLPLSGGILTGTLTLANSSVNIGTDTTELFRVYSSTGFGNGLSIFSIDNKTYINAKPYGKGTANALYLRTYNSGTVDALTLAANGNATFVGSVTATGFKKNGSSDSYILLGGGGHKLVSDFMLKTDELSNNLTTITKSLNVTQAWMDTGITSTNLPANGTYIVQVQVSANDETGNMYYCYSSGVMSWYKDGTNDVETDEIILHRSGHGYGKIIYLRTSMATSGNGDLKLQIGASSNIGNTYTYTFKFKRII